MSYISIAFSSLVLCHMIYTCGSHNIEGGYGVDVSFPIFRGIDKKSAQVIRRF